METGRRHRAVVAEYSRLAPDYDRRWRSYIRASTDETLARLPLPHGARLLDVGCGTGILLAAIARAYPDAALSGLDPVAAMLEQARARLRGAAALQQGWAECLPYADRSFDRVVSSSAFHYVDRPAAALAEMKRVLREGGVLLITDWCADFLGTRLLDRYLSLSDRAHHRAYRGDEFLRMLQEAGLSEGHVERYRVGPAWGLMSVRAVRVSG